MIIFTYIINLVSVGKIDFQRLNVKLFDDGVTDQLLLIS